MRALRGWTLQVQDTVQAGAWSAARTYTMTGPVAGTATGAPTLLAPADDALVGADADIELRWTPIEDAIGYQHQFASNAVNFDIVSPDVTSEGTVLVLSQHLEGDSTWKWRVRAIFDGGAAGAWSETRQVQLGPGHQRGARPHAAGRRVDPGVGASGSPGTPTAPRRSPSPSSAGRPTSAIRSPRGPQLNEETEPELDEGDWYWRVWTIGHPSNTVTEAHKVTIVDDVPPRGLRDDLGRRRRSSSPRAATRQRRGGAERRARQLAKIGLSPDGVTWTDFANAASGWSTPISTTDPEWGGPDPGRRDVWIRWEDAAGNRTTPVRLSYWYGVAQPTAPGAPRNPSRPSATARRPSAGTRRRRRASWPITGYEVARAPGRPACATTGLSCP